MSRWEFHIMLSETLVSSNDSSRELQIEGVNLLGADIARNEGNVTGTEPSPGSGTELFRKLAELLQVNQLLQL